MEAHGKAKMLMQIVRTPRQNGRSLVLYFWMRRNRFNDGKKLLCRNDGRVRMKHFLIVFGGELMIYKGLLRWRTVL